MAAQALVSAREELDFLQESRPSTSGNNFAISRRDIEFFNVGAVRVAIQIRVANTTGQPSPPDSVILWAAPFGAFVPWQPLAVVRVPALKPGQVVYLRTDAQAVHHLPLGRADRVPPRKLLTALGLEDQPPLEPADDKRSAQAPTQAQAPPPPQATMPPDLMQLLIQDTPHWVGNLNVMVGGADVERHRALALRVYPGRLNLAWFMVGSKTPDAYAFRISGCGADWNAKLFDMTSRETLVLDVADNTPIAPDRWIATTGTRTMLLALRPPKRCAAGAVEVQVCQKSTGRTAVVELDLDPKAGGRGCYAV